MNRPISLPLYPENLIIYCLRSGNLFGVWLKVAEAIVPTFGGPAIKTLGFNVKRQTGVAKMSFLNLHFGSLGDGRDVISSDGA